MYTAEASPDNHDSSQCPRTFRATSVTTEISCALHTRPPIALQRICLHGWNSPPAPFFHVAEGLKLIACANPIPTVKTKKPPSPPSTSTLQPLFSCRSNTQADCVHQHRSHREEAIKFFVRFRSSLFLLFPVHTRQIAVKG